MSIPFLQFDQISKSFFGVPVLREVSLALPAGEVLGLVGENGAGKSTLMNILGGVLRADSGRMLLDGEAYAPPAPADAARRGVGFIHQELNLFTNLSVAENIFIADFPKRRLAGFSLPMFSLIDRRAMRERTAALLDTLDLHVTPETLIESLSPGERQLVEIAKALSIEARLIILDEPTTSLTSRETERLFAVIERLRTQGISLIYISHVLEDVLRLSDRIVVLRDGAVVGAGARAEFTAEQMVRLMVGRKLEQLFPPRPNTLTNEVILEVRALTQPGIINNISFTLLRGEVLGVAGLMGSGRTELARILFGLDQFASGEIRVNGVVINSSSPRQRVERGMAFLTEDRRAEGLLMDASIADNIALASLPRYTSAAALDLAGLRQSVGKTAEAVQIKSANLNHQPVRTLSGGNQQKAVFAKWLLTEPSVFILDEPTRGIDVGAKHEVYRLINDLAARGAGMLLISSEIEELIGMCDRILVTAGGEIKDCLSRPEFDRERILRAALGAQAGSE